MQDTNKLHGIYVKALSQTGHKLTGKESAKQLQNKWQKYRADYAKRYHTAAPSLYETARYYQSDIPTIDFARDYVVNFINKVDTVYRDTLSFIDTNKEGTHDTGKLASISSYHISELAERYQEIKDIIRNLVSTYGMDVVAQAIADNVEIDYTIAVTLLPPSDVFFEFDETISQLLGITSQLSVRAAELQEQAEREMW